jgi:hypothetical protein
MRRKAVSLFAPLVSPLVALATPVLLWEAWQFNKPAIWALIIVHGVGFFYAFKKGPTKPIHELEEFRRNSETLYARTALGVALFVYAMAYLVFILLTWYVILNYRHYRGGQRLRAVPTTI